MLIPAILRKEEILLEFQKLQYTDDLMYEAGCCDNYMPDIAEEPDKETYQFAIVDSTDKLVGYIDYSIDWYSSQAHRFGLIKEAAGIRRQNKLNGQNTPVEAYKAYLSRYTRTKNITRKEAHQFLICKLVAEEYGVTKEDMEKLDMELT